MVSESLILKMAGQDEEVSAGDGMTAPPVSIWFCFPWKLFSFCVH